jgi:hypothetical protein
MARQNELNPRIKPLVLQTTGEEASEEIREEEFLQYCRGKPKRLFYLVCNRIEEHITALNRIVKEKETLNHELSELQKHVKAKEEAIAVLTVERDQFRNAFTQQHCRCNWALKRLTAPGEPPGSMIQPS